MSDLDQLWTELATALGKLTDQIDWMLALLPAGIGMRDMERLVRIKILMEKAAVLARAASDKRTDGL